MRTLLNKKKFNFKPPQTNGRYSFCGGGFVLSPQAVCPLWGWRTRTALFLQVTWAVFETCSHIEERCAPLMPYKPWLKARVYHYKLLAGLEQILPHKKSLLRVVPIKVAPKRTNCLRVWICSSPTVLIYWIFRYMLIYLINGPCNFFILIWLTNMEGESWGRGSYIVFYFYFW